MPPAKQPVKSHILELRTRLIRTALLFSAFFGLSLWRSPWILGEVRKQFMQPDVSLLAVTPGEVFSTYMLVSFYVAAILSVPVATYEAARYFAPAVRKKSRKKLVFYSVGVLLMFFAGVAFGYRVLCPVALRFFAHLGSEAGVWNAWSVRALAGFVLKTSFYTGIGFLTPVVVNALRELGIIKGDISKWRRQAYVLIFLLAALITPPDVVSQLMMAVPMIILYELSVIGSRKKRN